MNILVAQKIDAQQAPDLLLVVAALVEVAVMDHLGEVGWTAPFGRFDGTGDEVTDFVFWQVRAAAAAQQQSPCPQQ
jgi:hypothetical protein